jgi:hypothetical protein
MTPVSSVTARLMETWAHGQDILDALGTSPVATERLRHVADLGIRAMPYSYAINDLPLPTDPIMVELISPDGAVWIWGSADAVNRIEGNAMDFLPRGHAAQAPPRHGSGRDRSGRSTADLHCAGFRWAGGTRPGSGRAAGDGC